MSLDKPASRAISTSEFYNRWVIENDPDRLTAVFTALADPTRRAILARLTEGDASVTELAAPFPIGQPAVSKHLRVLERAGLISRNRAATARLSHLEASPFRDAARRMEQYRRFGTPASTGSTPH
jgi:DNA-binding transcriptional ArsR family regulator